VPVVRVALAQLNLTVGDLDGNVARVLAALERAEDAGADVAVFPELSITGYPPEDLLLKPGFVADNVRALNRVVRATRSCAAVVGFVERGRAGGIFNSACVARGGKRVGVYRKRHLPNYAVFDERRYFETGRGGHRLYEVGGVQIGVSVCEDAWQAGDGPIARQGELGADLIVNLNASPFYAGRWREREAILRARAAEAGAPIVYVNQVGGQDELVFDGNSMVVDAAGDVRCRLPQFVEEVAVVDVDLDTGETSPSVLASPFEVDHEVYEATVIATRDYVRKNGFSDVVIGLSGGIDSSLVACIAVDALGAEHVHGISMPSRYSSEGSKDDARALAERLGIDYRTIAIEPAHAALLEMLGPSLGERPPNVTEENLQSRVRGVVNMAFTNELSWLVLVTGNKSEVAVGYYTLYGDSAGAYAPIKDVFKTEVWRLARFVNDRAGREIIPEVVITKPPSAELRPDQVDQDSLPPYEVLDPILEAYVEQDRTRDEVIAAGHDAAVVDRVVRLVDLAEHKRRQSPPGARVSPKAFGKDRRMPITNGYRR